MEVHIVQKGDTLWKISRQHGISFDELKRVNAHLANPDYIVPGMKIFLPEKSKGQEGSKKPGKTEKPVKPSPGEGVEKKPEKKPAPLPPLPTPPVMEEEELTLPKPPPSMPEWTPPPMPEWTPPPAPEWRPQPAPMPEMTPPSPPSQPQTQPICPTCSQPQVIPMSIIGIPCGWMPIYDADCYPMMHPGQMHPSPPQQAPHYESPMQPTPYPFPLPTPQLPVENELEVEAEIGPVPLPEEEAISEPWQMTESPGIPAEKPKTNVKKPVPPPVELPQADYNYPPQFQAPSAPCGCNSQFGGHHPMPMPMPVPMPSPFPPVNHCNACNQPIQMMPCPPTHNWHGGC